MLGLIATCQRSLQPSVLTDDDRIALGSIGRLQLGKLRLHITLFAPGGIMVGGMIGCAPVVEGITACRVIRSAELPRIVEVYLNHQPACTLGQLGCIHKRR